MTPITRSDLSEYQTSENRLTPRLVPSWRSICSTHPSQTLEVMSPCLMFGEIPSQFASSFAMDPSSTLQRTLFRALYTIYHCTQRGSTALYTKGETLTLWIDALCINQRDVPEKNCQVPIMGSNYQRAKGAIGYVGSPSEGTDPINAILSMAWWANCPIIKPPDDLTTDRSDPRFQAWLHEAQKRASASRLQL
jgi:hypothetical protein